MCMRGALVSALWPRPDPRQAKFDHIIAHLTPEETEYYTTLWISTGVMHGGRLEGKHAFEFLSK